MSITPSTNYSIGSSPVRIGYNIAGSLIINRSQTATAWFGPSFDVGAGRQGSTPLYPGTSVRWDRPGDLYAALGNDADSIAAGTVALTVSDQITGWQPDPVAQGAAIAASLFTQGIRMPLVTNLLVSDILDATGNSTITVDVHDWTKQTIQVDMAIGSLLNIRCEDAAGNMIYQRRLAGWPETIVVDIGMGAHYLELTAITGTSIFVDVRGSTGAVHRSFAVSVPSGGFTEYGIVIPNTQWIMRDLPPLEGQCSFRAMAVSGGSASAIVDFRSDLNGSGLGYFGREPFVLRSGWWQYQNGLPWRLSPQWRNAVYIENNTGVSMVVQIAATWWID